MIRFKLQNASLSSWITFHQTYDLLARLSQEAFAETPVSSEEYKVLLVVKNHPSPVSQVDIARWVNRSPNTVSALLFRMEEEGLIRRTRDSMDRRVVHVVLTRKGKLAYKQASVVAWNLVSKAMDALTEAERQVLVQLLYKLQERAASFSSNGQQPIEVVSFDG